MIYTVLSDRSTFDCCDGTFIAILNDSGERVLSESGDYKHVSADGILEEISLNDLINAYRILKKL